jgi:hypothetical protein
VTEPDEGGGGCGAPRTRVILVHGVGAPARGSVKAAAERNLGLAGLPLGHVVEHNWNLLVTQPYGGSERVMCLEFLASLGRGLLGSAWLPVVKEGLRGTSRHRMLVLLGVAYEVVCLATPVLWLASVVLLPRALRVGSLTALGLAGAQLLVAASFASRHTLLATLRRVVLIAAWLPASAVGSLGVIGWRYVCPVLVGIALIVALVQSDWELMEQAPGSVPLVYRPNSLWYLIEGAVFLLAVAAGSGLAALVYHALKLVLGPLTKVLADVFRYLGISDYREERVRALRESLERQRGDRLILATHSLGTVISRDALLEIDPDRIAPRVEWITAGCPLRDLMHLFFPFQYSHPRETLRSLRLRSPGINWVNVYRPMDPIGRHLGLGCDRDKSTGQWIGRNFGPLAHVDYWGDPQVYRSISEVLESAAPVEDPAEDREPCWEQVEREEPRLALGLCMTHVVSLLLIAVAIQFPLLSTFRADDIRRTLQEDGVRVEDGIAYYYLTERYSQTSGSVLDEIMRVRFRSPDAEDSPHTASPNGLLVDKGSLRSFLSQADKCVPFEGERESRTATVTVVHDPADHTRFTIEGHEQLSTSWDVKVAAGGISLVFMAVLSAVYSLFWSHGGRSLWLMFFAQRPGDAAGLWRDRVAERWSQLYDHEDLGSCGTLLVFMSIMAIITWLGSYLKFIF